MFFDEKTKKAEKRSTTQTKISQNPLSLPKLPSREQKRSALKTCPFTFSLGPTSDQAMPVFFVAKNPIYAIIEKK